LESLIDGLPPEYAGQIGAVEIANPAPDFQFGVICGTVAGPQAAVLVPDR
jgi:hypothetical protein